MYVKDDSLLSCHKKLIKMVHQTFLTTRASKKNATRDDTVHFMIKALKLP